MPKRNAGRRGRARKRRGTGAAPAQAPEHGIAPTRTASAASAGAAKTTTRQRGARRPPAERGVHRDPGGVGERPEAPWHPWPFSELLIFAGAIGTIIGVIRQQGPLLYAGLGAVVLGTLEFTIREHRTGYRSHTTLLAAVPVALVHGAVALGLYAAGARGEVLVLAPIAVDVPLFWVLFRFLRGRFEDARRERVFALGRR